MNKTAEEMEDDSEEIHSTSLIKRYTERPTSIENITLADWAALYDSPKSSFMKKSKSLDTDNLLLETGKDDDNDDEFTDFVEEGKHNAKIAESKQHLKPRIIRSVCFNVKSLSENHFRELIMLFTCWQNEEADLIGSSSPYQECDLFQLEPVMDGYIFKDLQNSDYTVLAPSLWQKYFSVFQFEFTEIMQQRDSKLFAELPNRKDLVPNILVTNIA
ncbi:hypothetical protein AWC38_SpisGene3014 [Stylophora pistillata]|uniref:Uncharacterized protein n=1 Tax=Stylophora pistillata TaxID=50429 RepID=A0A2B4SSY4_STYPI|nr:hypothetical protein AWC38_SpisGene3014 [Stylophora pistillata]